MLFFLLAGLIKTSSLLPYFGLGGVAVLDLMGRLRQPGAESCFHLSLSTSFLTLEYLVLIAGWYYYAKVYSDAHQEVFLPWRQGLSGYLNQESIQEVLDRMKYWFRHGDYHNRIFLILSLVLFLGMLPIL